MDGIVCLMATIQILTPYMWMTGLPFWDLVICQFWHGQGIYWATFLVSIYNLIAIAYERYLTVCHPLQRSSFTLRRLRGLLSLLYIYSYILQPIPTFFQVHYLSGQCLPEYYFQTHGFRLFMAVYAVYTFLTYYAIPVLAFVILYGSILHKLQHRQHKDSSLGPSRIIKTANTQLTKTGIIVTVFFALSVGYDLWYYLLGNVGLVSYQKNSLSQKIGVFLAVSNSCVNPFIYVICMTTFRKSLIDLLTCRDPVRKVTDRYK